MVRNWRQKILLVILVLLLIGFGLPAKAVEGDYVWTELARTELGRHLPDTLIDQEIFIRAAVEFLSFEKGEDPLFIARKRGYLPPGDLSRPITLGQALSVLMQLIAVDRGADAVQGAWKLGICDLASNLGQVLSVTMAEELLVETRTAWYEFLESEQPAERVRAADYYLTSSVFKFSEDETKIIFDEKGIPQVIDLHDGSRIPFDPTLLASDSRELWPPEEGKAFYEIYDNNGVLRTLVVEESPRYNFTTAKYILYRENDGEPWQRIVDFDLSLNRDYEIVGFTPDNQRLYVKTNFYDNYVTLYEVNPETQERTVLYRNPSADVATNLVKLLMGVPSPDLRHPQTGKLLASYYVEDKLHPVFFDNSLAEVMGDVTRELGPNHYPILTSSDGEHLVIQHLDDRDLGTYYLVNTTLGQIHKLVEPAIPRANIARTYPVSFQGSDGEAVFAYLTIPLGKSPHHLPLLINAHGGPELRFAWTPNPQTIVASNLGIAVLSVNFRFSLGYGTAYVDAGSHDKLLPQRDIRDAALWAVQMGIAEPDQIGVMGHSYGGYSSFYQAAVYPDLYMLAIPQMGVWDWGDLGAELAQGDPLPADHLRTGPLPGTGQARLMSPSSFVSSLKAPLLIVHAGLDEAVYPSQNIRAIRELEEAGCAPSVLFLPDDPHNFTSYESIDLTLETMREFLEDQYGSTNR